MRIVAGMYGGRIISAPKHPGTRPMTDKVRASLFDSLGVIKGSTLLDAYAGSGAIGFEALSRGAENVQAIEHARDAIKTIKKNQEILGIDWGYSLHQMTVEVWLAHGQDQQFDVIVADPPYEHMKDDVLDKLGRLLATDGIMVVSHSSRLEPPKLEGLVQVGSRSYGDSMLSSYHRAARIGDKSTVV
jgi:16S rRNA (guanine966-N2)-methyltransferase